jgi:hypothetical protein
MASKNNPVFKAIELVNRGKSYPALSLVNDNPELASLMSKLVTPVINPTYGANGRRELPNPNNTEFKSISQRRANAINDSQTVMQLLPDMELSAQILVSSILSPKDLMSGDMTFIPPEGILNSQTTAAIVQLLRKHFDQAYKIKPELGKILRNMLFERGSHVMVVIPENSLDEVINRNTNITMESISSLVNRDGTLSSLGILGSRIKETGGANGQAFKGISLENFKSYDFKTNTTSNLQIQLDNNNILTALEHIVVGDNVDVLKFPFIEKRLREQRVAQALKGSTGMGVESAGLAPEQTPRQTNIAGSSTRIKSFNDSQLSHLVYKNKPIGYTPIITLKTDAQLARRSVGAPLVMELPSEAIIPVHMPGHPSKHIGFFVMLDANGNPVSKDLNKDYYGELQGRMTGGGSDAQSSGLLKRLQSSLNGFTLGDRDHIDYSARVYAEMVEQDLLARLRNGIYTNGAALAKNEEVFRIMLARTLAAQQTQLLFIPIEMMTYFAFKYNDDGTGKSLLEDMKMINSLRAMLMFANIQASVRNSIGRVGANIKFDEDDPDPHKTLEIMMDTVMRSRQGSFPLGANNPVDIVNYLSRAGIEFTYEGHPGMPDVKIDFTEKSTNYIKPDTELEENLRKRSINAVGLSPEMLDANSGAEFATSVVNNNIMLSRRVMQLQDDFVPQVMDHLRKVIRATPRLVEDLRQIIDDNYEANKERLDPAILEALEGPQERTGAVSQFLQDFLNGLEIQLPRPNTITMENQSKALDEYIELLDKGLDAVINDRFFNTDLTGTVATNVVAIKEVVRSHFIRTWFAENGVLPELAQITTSDEDGKPKINFWDDNQSHISALMKSLTQFMVSIQTPKAEADSALQASGVPEGSGGTDSYSPDSSSGGSGMGGGSDDFGLSGADDLGGLGDDTSSDDDSSETSEETTEESSETTSSTTEVTDDSQNPDEETDEEAKGDKLL